MREQVAVFERAQSAVADRATELARRLEQLEEHTAHLDKQHRRPAAAAPEP